MKLTWDIYDDPDNPTEPESSLVKEPPSPGLFYGPDDSMEREYEEPELPEPKPERPFKNDYRLYNTLREGFLKAMEECIGGTEQSKNSIYYRLGRFKQVQEGMGLSNEKIRSMKYKTLEELTAIKLKRTGLYDRSEFMERVKAKEEPVLVKPTSENLVMERGVGWGLFEEHIKLTRNQRAVLWFLMTKLFNVKLAEEKDEFIFFTPKELQNVLGEEGFLAWQIKDALDRLGMITFSYVRHWKEKRWDKVEIDVEEGTRKQAIQPYWLKIGEAVVRKDVPEEHRTKWFFGAKFEKQFKLILISNLIEKRFRLVPAKAFKLKDRAEIVLEYFLLHEASQRIKVVGIDYETFWKKIFMISEPERIDNFITEIKKALGTLEKRMNLYWGKKGRGVKTKFYLSKLEKDLDFCRLGNTK